MEPIRPIDLQIAIEAGRDALAVLDARPEFPPPIRADGSHHYVSTACACTGDKLMPDGRTGHEYCAAMTGWQGAKRGGRAKCCGAPCQCPCHQGKSAAAARAVAAGGNAEDCPQCVGTNPPYPFLCPGHPASPLRTPATPEATALPTQATPVSEGGGQS